MHRFLYRCMLPNNTTHRLRSAQYANKHTCGSGSRENAIVGSCPRLNDWYEKNGIELHLGDKALSIDKAAKTVTSAKGLTISYDKLVMATGSTPFVPPLPGIEKDGVLVYRTIEDLDDIQFYAK